MKGFNLPILCCLLVLFSCTRKEIEFGTIPENAYTNLAYIDTVSVQLSTVLNDSFATNGDTAFLFGRYKDPYLGAISTRPFLQMTVPVNLPDIPASAVFDSLSLIIKPNKYYYGDTSKTQTIMVYELAQAIAHTYNNQLFNTSNVPVKTMPLGSKATRFSPTMTDTISIKLNTAKGIEIFNKLRQKTTDITAQTEFLNYFNGISIGVSDNDTSAVYGLKATDAAVVMRVHYHTTIPYPEQAFIDFTSLANEFAFTQILPNRTGTGLAPITPGLTEIFPAATQQTSFLQPGSGLSLKMIFPSLRSILNKGNGGLVKLIKAELIVKPKYLSSDRYLYKLPANLGLAQTDATNLLGSSLLDSTGQAALTATPVIDDIYGINNYYRFNVTSYINLFMTTPGSERWKSNRGPSPTQPAVSSRAWATASTEEKRPRGSEPSSDTTCAGASFSRATHVNCSAVSGNTAP
ncbi:MAG: DUF4270 family protein [Sphingobacteriales bacterium]|nr:MAG: DUF4270 family protein [Sphingobacteriales bacterium]